jgi:hypothetical protein
VDGRTGKAVPRKLLTTAMTNRKTTKRQGETEERKVRTHPPCSRCTLTFGGRPNRKTSAKKAAEDGDDESEKETAGKKPKKARCVPPESFSRRTLTFGGRPNRKTSAMKAAEEAAVPVPAKLTA